MDLNKSKTQSEVWNYYVAVVEEKEEESGLLLFIGWAVARQIRRTETIDGLLFRNRRFLWLVGFLPSRIDFPSHSMQNHNNR